MIDILINKFQMKSEIRRIINLFFFILLTNTQFSKAHNLLNGGCGYHCEDSFLQKKFEEKIEEKIEDINKNQIEDNYSCLTKSLCRG